jgi:TrmH family RNA methyltransferase
VKVLTLARDLQRRRARERQGLFVAEGVRAVEELLRSTLRIRAVLTSPALASAPRGRALVDELRARGVIAQEVREADFASAADTDSPQGVLAIAEVPRRTLESLELPVRARLLVLDGIQDPGNAGTLLRTAAALGAAATVALPGTVDVWNAKVVRSAMGSLFHGAVYSSTWEALDTFLRDQSIELWGADRAGEPLGALAPPARLALVVGNEGSGLSERARVRLARRVSIPIAADVDSLNVAVAAGILLYELRA